MQQALARLPITASILVASLSGAAAVNAADRWVIRSVNVVDVEQATVAGARDVYLRDGRIEAIRPAEDPHLSVSLAVDGENRYLIPALADMHVHLEYFDDPQMLWLFLANGVSLVRQMDGRPYLIEWRDRVAEGGLPGPDIHTAGPIIDGTPAGQPDIAQVDGAAEARREALAQLERGYDFLKIYHGLDAEEFAAVAAVAAGRKARLVGHVPFRVGLRAAIAQGLDSIEHLDGYDDLIQAEDSPFLSGWHWQNQYLAVPVDERRLKAIATETAQTGVWNCPTLTVKNLLPLHPDLLGRSLARPELDFLPETMTGQWDPRRWTDERGDRYRSLEASDWQALRAGIETARSVVFALHRAGGKLLAGTDTPNPMIVPGFSIHDELEQFVAAGLTPAEALYSATIAPRHYLYGGDISILRPGARADLVLLDANPLQDIHATRAIHGVVRRGEWLSRSQLDEQLDRLRASER